MVMCFVVGGCVSGIKPPPRGKKYVTPPGAGVGVKELRKGRNWVRGLKE